MQRSFLKTFLSFFCAFFIAVLAVLTPYNSYAIYEGVRDGIGFKSGKGLDENSNKCDTGSIAFDPFSENKDIYWDLSNPTCIGYITAVGWTMKSADVAHRVACLPPVAISADAIADATIDAPILTAWLPSAILTPIIFLRQVHGAKQCISRGISSVKWSGLCSTNAANCIEAGKASADAVKCCNSMVHYAQAVARAIIALSIIWDVAKNTYENARVCGSEWQSWVQDDKVAWKREKGPYRKCIDELFLNHEGPVSAYCTSSYKILGYESQRQAKIENSFYREYIYGGKEFEDRGDNSCDNPENETGIFDRQENLGYTSEKQRYYMTGPGAAPVYACYRFLTAKKSASTQKAYDCCRRRSQNAICIENRTGLGNLLGPYDHKFCEIGSTCVIQNVTFSAYASKTQSNYVCAKTYSVCPYNHLLAGGTETKKVNAADTTLVDNFCQYMNHCSKLPILPYVRSSNLEGAFISASCKDLKGDSQNVYGYTSQLIPINTKNFSAPMAQCFKETLENLFLNVAGGTKCKNPDEDPNSSGVCESGYAYQRGHSLKTKSFFLKVQENLQSVIKMTLTISIMFFGYMILQGGGSVITKKQLLPYIVKIGLVMYFAVGDGWQYGFMKGVLGTSTLLSDIMFRVDESGDPDTLDGCQFPRFNYADQNEDTKYSQNASYPPGSEYLRIWDTLDCKIARALGFGPEVSVPNLIFMILGGFLTGGLGMVFVVASFTLGFFMISLTIRALHIFLLSITSIIILMYVSPIAITAALFDKTKNIFDGWWKQMLGFTLQPMILFAYLGILITLFDKIIIGDDVRFTGDGKQNPKQMICSDEAKNKSIICIFRIPDIKTFRGFEVLGVGLPMLGSMNQEKLESIMKAALIMFIFMKFMDQITGFASKLVGGAELSSDWDASASGMAKNAYGTLRGIQQRGMRVGKAGLKSVMRAGGEAKSMIGAMGNRGKSSAAPNKDSGSDHQPAAQGSTTGGSDNANVGTPAGGSDNASRGSQSPVDNSVSDDSGDDNEAPENDEGNNSESSSSSKEQASSSSSAAPSSENKKTQEKAESSSASSSKEAVSSNPSSSKKAASSDSPAPQGAASSTPPPTEAESTSDSTEKSDGGAKDQQPKAEAASSSDTKKSSASESSAKEATEEATNSPSPPASEEATNSPSPPASSPTPSTSNSNSTEKSNGDDGDKKEQQPKAEDGSSSASSSYEKKGGGVEDQPKSEGVSSSNGKVLPNEPLEKQTTPDSSSYEKRGGVVEEQQSKVEAGSSSNDKAFPVNEPLEKEMTDYSPPPTPTQEKAQGDDTSAPSTISPPTQDSAASAVADSKAGNTSAAQESSATKTSESPPSSNEPAPTSNTKVGGEKNIKPKKTKYSDDTASSNAKKRDKRPDPQERKPINVDTSPNKHSATSITKKIGGGGK